MRILATRIPSKVKSLKMLHEQGWDVPPTVVVEHPSQIERFGITTYFQDATHAYLRLIWDGQDGKSQQREGVCILDDLLVEASKLVESCKSGGVLVLQPILASVYGGCVLFTREVSIF